MQLIINEPILREDLADTIRLFFGLESVEVRGPEASVQGEPTVIFTVEESGKAWNMRARLLLPAQPEACAGITVPMPERGDEVVYKRMMRRHAKLCLYHLLREKTGLRPPWGSLTGIRPTRLFRGIMGEGRSMDEAGRYFTQVLDVSTEKTRLIEDIIEAQQGKIEFGNGGVADVYVGIPFCRTRCLYCSFISVDLSRTREWVDPYAEALLGEIDHGAALLRDAGKEVRSVYVGGGTPTAIGRERLQRVLEKIRSQFCGDYEFTVEAGRPDTLDDDMLSMIHGCGAGRISINPQTMNEDTLRRIGRGHTPEDVLRAMEQASRVPFDAVNMDLIMGLPGEGSEEVEHTLRMVERLPIHNLTVHTLAVKRASALRETMDQYSMPPPQTVQQAIEQSREAARRMGMRPYYLYRQKYMTGNLENTGYALPEKECLYNIDMMEETHHVLALGAGGISKRMDFQRSFHERLANPKGVPHYIERIGEVMNKKQKFFLR